MLTWAFWYFFFLMSAYYLLRPLRDEMGIAGGIHHLHYLFSLSFIIFLLIAPAFGYLVKKFRPQQFLQPVYYFFGGNILLFYFLFQFGSSNVLLARIFFIWLSIFNLFVISILWSFMNDIFSVEQSRRLFATIAGGGSLGAIAGPLLVTLLVQPLGPINLLPISALLLGLSIFFLKKLIRWSNASREKRGNTFVTPEKEQAIGGHIFGGFSAIYRSKYLQGIALLIVLYTSTSTFLYFEQAYIIAQTISSASLRTLYFAGIDLSTQFLALTIQLLISSRLLKRFGLAFLLALGPILTSIGFLVLSFSTTLILLVVIIIIHRAVGFSILRPGREMLFAVTNGEERYKAKNIIDTVVYRGGDALSSWGFTGLYGLGIGLSGISLVAIPLAIFGAFVGWNMGKRLSRFRPGGRGILGKPLNQKQ